MATDKSTDTTRARATDGMGGRGFYDGHSQSQRDALELQEQRLRDAARRLDASAEELRLMDLGCGPGRNSMVAFRTVLDELRGMAPDIPVVAVHNDQAGNDWNGLVANVTGPDGYLKDGGPVRLELSVGSFFEAVASLSSVDLAMSFAAAHWFAHPVHLATPGTLFFSDVTGPARHELAETAGRDWNRFLRHRAKELKLGATMIVTQLASAPDPDDPSGLTVGGRGLYRALWQVADKMAAEGRIDRGLLDDFVFPVYFRSGEELRAPIEHEDDLKAAFDIVELAVEVFPMPIQDTFSRTGDAKTYAAAYAGFARSFAESTLRHALFEGSAADPGGVDVLTDEYFRRLEDLFAAEPDRHSFEHLVSTLVVRRR
jgi:hypothetical protein